ncbi:MAG: trigger factor [Tenacibaculum sp.]|nr:trigger factor [Tenacibaculum sp.]
MNITKESIDALSTVVKVDIVADDYKGKVEEILKDYRKKANIPGFRKGHVPMTMVKKQYGKSIMIDEVNKLLQKSLNKYLADEKIEILGDPLPRTQEDFSWDNEDFSFEFELGLAPVFEVDLKKKMKVTKYDIKVTDELIEEEVENIRKRYGKMSPLEEITEEANVAGTLVNEEEGIDKKTAFNVKDIKGKTNLKKLLGAKKGDVIELKTKNLFEKDYILASSLNITEEEAKNLNISLKLTIDAITLTEPADLDKELFDKLFASKNVNTVTELKEKIKLSAEKQFKTQSDQQLLNDITSNLVENTKFDLPEKFIKKWLQTSGEEQLTEEQASEKFEQSEKGLRYQLIEGRLIKDNDIAVDNMELVNYAKEMIKNQMAQFANEEPKDEELNAIVGRVLSNKEEYQRLQTQLVSEKLLNLFKENVSYKTKEVTHEEFLKEVYKK